MKLALIFGLVAFAGTAHAQFAQAPTAQGAAGVCAITAKMHIVSEHFIIFGGTTGQGTGEISCVYADGGKEIIPVSIRTNLSGVGIGYSDKSAQLAAAGIGVAPGGARDLLGRYGVAQGSAQIAVVGVQGGLGLELKRDDGFSIPATLGFTEGIGLDGAVDAGTMDIQPLPLP